MHGTELTEDERSGEGVPPAPATPPGGAPPASDSGAPEVFVPRRSGRRRNVTDEVSDDDGSAASGADDTPAAPAPFSVPRLEMPWVDPPPHQPELRAHLPGAEPSKPSTAAEQVDDTAASPSDDDDPPAADGTRAEDREVVEPGVEVETLFTDHVRASSEVASSDLSVGSMPPPPPPAPAQPLAPPSPAPGVPPPPAPVAPAPSAPAPVAPSPAPGATPAVTTPLAPVVLPPAATPPPRSPVPPAKRRTRKRRWRRVFAWLVVLALVATGALLGRNYLLDRTWEADARDVADSVEELRGNSFSKAVDLEELERPAFTAKAYDVVFGGTAAEQQAAASRAMGLLQGGYSSLSTAAELGEGRVAIYDPAEGSVAVDVTAVDDEQRYAALVREMDVALANQRSGWAEGWGELTRSERIARRALVEGDAVLLANRWLRRATGAPAIPGDAPALPAVVLPGAPQSGVPDDVLLEGALSRSVGPWAMLTLGGMTEVEPVARDLATSDAAVWDPVVALEGRTFERFGTSDVRGMGYWYLVMASRLDPSLAWPAARAWAGDRQEVVEREGRVCVLSTISTTDDLAQFVLVATLQSWVDLGPAEANASVQPTATGSVVVESCDPGPEVVTRLRTTGPAELAALSIAGWQVAHVARTVAASVADATPEAVEAPAVDPVEELLDPGAAGEPGDATGQVPGAPILPGAPDAACAVRAAHDAGIVAQVASALLNAAPADRARVLDESISTVTLGGLLAAC